MDYEQARFNMIEQQVRTWEVLDQNILDLLGVVHREDFVPDAYKKLALADVSIPLLHEQVMMTPKIEARLLQALTISASDKVLEIGTGSAYLTALLARLAKQVVSIDIFPEFTEQAAIKLADHGIHNVSLHTANAIDGWTDTGPYNVIAVTGSLPTPNHPLELQLSEGGRMFVITGTSPVMSAVLITRTGNNDWTREPLFETDLPPLIGAETPARFRF
jgi:protein-L-isoaspartate(D-aspartate) O-methyltransferase